MKSSTKISFEDYDKPLTLKEKIKVGGLLSIPFAITAILGSFDYTDHEKKVLEPYFKEGLQKPKVEYIEPKFNSARGDRLIPDAKTGGVVLHLNGVDIVTGLSNEQILEQLDFDFYDILDYYGGEETF